MRPAAGATYTGPDQLGCALTFDKDVEHLLPAVVKPVEGGSSNGGVGRPDGR